MGFLSGAYGKIIAKKQYLRIQHELNDVSRQLMRVTRQVGNYEKMLTARQSSMQHVMRMQMMGGQRGVWASYQEHLGLAGTEDAKMTAYERYQQNMQQLQWQQSMAMEYMQMAIEEQRNMMLEPLKDLENELTLRKETLDSQLQLAKNEYEAKQKEEKEGAKSFTPDYTGNG